MLDSNEKYLARTFFKNKILSYDSQSYESLFTQVMQIHNPNFEQVKPYGNLGDCKNDGYDRTTGTYYQVYAPEDIEKANTIKHAAGKLNSDFNGLYNQWNSLYPIKHFFYVINDKYKGAPVQLHTAKASLSKEYPFVTFDFFLSKDLEDCFMQFSDDDMINIVGSIPNPSIKLDFSALKDVIEHLMNSSGDDLLYNHLIVPDFDEKIQFNRLSQPIAQQLRAASYQVGILDSYFRCNSDYTKSQIQQKISAAYIEASAAIDRSSEQYGDLVFLKLLESIYPNGTLSIRTAIMILLAYYFETCDIFERPAKEIQI